MWKEEECGAWKGGWGEVGTCQCKPHLSLPLSSPYLQNEQCIAFGPGVDMMDSTRIIGERQFEAGKVLAFNDL